jgi:hypothetical protein
MPVPFRGSGKRPKPRAPVPGRISQADCPCNARPPCDTRRPCRAGRTCGPCCGSPSLARMPGKPTGKSPDPKSLDPKSLDPMCLPAAASRHKNAAWIKVSGVIRDATDCCAASACPKSRPCRRNTAIDHQAARSANAKCLSLANCRRSETERRYGSTGAIPVSGSPRRLRLNNCKARSLSRTPSRGAPGLQSLPRCTQRAPLAMLAQQRTRLAARSASFAT